MVSTTTVLTITICYTVVMKRQFPLTASVNGHRTLTAIPVTHG